MLSDACHEFLSGFAELARELADHAHHYADPSATLRYGEEVDALRRVSMKVADGPTDAEAGAHLLRLAVSVLRYLDGPPEAPGEADREREMMALVRILQTSMGPAEAATVPALVEEMSKGGPGSEAVASRLQAIMARLGKPAYDMAVKIVSDIASATVKRMLGL